MIGFRGTVGVVNFIDLTADRGYASKGPTSGTTPPPYFYCDTWTGITNDAEIPIDQVRAAAREFLRTAERPTNVEWQ